MISPRTSFREGSAITDVPGIKVGHYTYRQKPTGCTVILCEEGAVGGVDVRGAAPGTRETDLLSPLNLVQQVHAIALSGGSAFGLETATGVMRCLEERGMRLGDSHDGLVDVDQTEVLLIHGVLV